jgi:hypothetical protein
MAALAVAGEAVLFWKKEPKTFVCWRRSSRPGAFDSKVFLLLFLQKKKAFLLTRASIRVRFAGCRPFG